jgi:hypothetical protein
MVMGVAFVLDCSSVVVNSQTVADQDAAEVFSENVLEQVTSTALSNDIEGEVQSSENPQPPARSADPPAGLIAMKHRCLAQFCSDGVILRFYFDSEPIQRLGESAGAQLQLEAIAQDGTGFSHGKTLGLVEIGG